MDEKYLSIYGSFTTSFIDVFNAVHVPKTHATSSSMYMEGISATSLTTVPKKKRAQTSRTTSVHLWSHPLLLSRLGKLALSFPVRSQCLSFPLPTFFYAWIFAISCQIVHDGLSII
jgi:hypothetical protein